jgi:hypothetical protein
MPTCKWERGWETFFQEDSGDDGKCTPWEACSLHVTIATFPSVAKGTQGVGTADLWQGVLGEP